MSPLTPADTDEHCATFDRVTPANASAYERQSYARETEEHHPSWPPRVGIAATVVFGIALLWCAR